MKQARISIGCKDWQRIVAELGPEAAGTLLYLITLMRNIQSAEVTVRADELANELHISTQTACAALDRIVEGGYLARFQDESGMITLRSVDEERRQAEARRKRAARILSRSKFGGQSTGQSGRSRTCTTEVRSAPRADEQDGQSRHIFFNQSGQSTDSPQEVYSEVAMYYHPGPGEPRDESSYYFRKKKEKEKHTLFNQAKHDGQKEKAPRTPEKEKSLTEFTGPAHTPTHAHEAELPADQLEADYIDVIGSWPNSLREALRNETPDVRESFYLYVRTKQADDGKAWSADKVRIAWLAARRVPAERRADSILAASMAGWKTIRDSGSGVYFEKSTGRIVSLVRGPVEAVSPRGGTASDAAREFVRRMREE